MTFDWTTWPHHTERLTLRPAEPADLPAIYAFRSLPEAAEWMPSLPTSYEEFVLRQGASDAMDRCLVMVLDDQVIGDLYLFVNNGWAQSEVSAQGRGSQAEIGWCLAPAHQGKGYVTEAVRELVRLCFEDLGVRRLTAEAFADNEPSLRVMERVGMQREAVHRRESLHRDRGWLDGVVYAILRDEWAADRP